MEETKKLHPLLVQLLLRRGFSSPEEVEQFLYGNLSHLPDPWKLPDMSLAVDRLIHAFRKKEKVVLFGDYDVDGMTGTAQLAAFFQDLGHPVEPCLPHRLTEGYGLTAASVQKILSLKPDLVVTIDNGTTALKEIQSLKDHGADVIVVDHHETPHQRPSVVALVNPKSPGSSFPERDIASAGLIFLLLMAMRARLREEGVSDLPNLKRYLDLCCLGTIADVVPLIGTNRLLVKYGLKELETTQRPGLKALMKLASVNTPLTASTAAFRLIPRLNAAGRLASPTLSLNLLLSKDDQESFVLANQLEDLNRERQKLEEKATHEAIQMVKENQNEFKGLVVASPHWHLGIVGIVASRLVDYFNRPSIVLSTDLQKNLAKGSARTVQGISVHKVLKTLSEELLSFGGHDAACGLSLALDALPSFAHKFSEAVNQIYPDYPPLSLAPFPIDATLELHQINSELIEMLNLLQPFGSGNPEPTFMSSPVRLNAPRVVGEKHLKMVVTQDKNHLEAIAFNWLRTKSTFSPPVISDDYEVSFFPELNCWNGLESIQLRVKNLSLQK